MDVDSLLKTNLLGVDPSTPIYRIAQVKYVLKDIADRKLTIRRVITWEDPHEAAFFRRSVRMEDGHTVSLGSLAKSWFGQCWSLLPESDAMWRIYNKSNAAALDQGVRLQTTVGRLLAALFDAGVAARPKFRDWAAVALFLGKVSYHGEQSMRALLARPVSEYLSGFMHYGAGNVLLKREAFAHEAEIRLLYQLLDDGAYREQGLDGGRGHHG